MTSLSLLATFLKTMKAYEKVEADEADEEEMDAAVDGFGEVQDMLRQQDTFSVGETIDDFTTQSLKYFPVGFYLAHVISKSPDMLQRARKLEIGTAGMITFLEQCRDAEMPNEGLNLKEYLAALDEGREYTLAKTGETIRDQKIAEYREQKARKERIKHLIVYLSALEANSGDNDDHVDTEEEKRELYILQIQSCMSKAVSEMKMMRTELELLQHRTEMVSSGVNMALPRPEDMPPSKGIEVTRYNKVDGQLVMERETVKANVFTPRFQAPTMSLDAFAQQEMDQIAVQQAREGTSEPGPRRYEHLVRDGDEDNADLVEAAAYQDREWDAFKEANPKGWGNRHGKKF
jgi:immunoglobulin-binding protein 1